MVILSRLKPGALGNMNKDNDFCNVASKGNHIVLICICIAGVLIPIVFSGPAIALPDISKEFDSDVFTLSWIVNAYNVSLGSLVMAGGALSDKIGRKKCFITGLMLFFITSLIISITSHIGIFIIFRILEGVGGALTLTAGSSIIAQEYQGHSRTQAFSLLGASFGVGLAFGPLLTGGIIENWGWRALFLTISTVSALITLIIFNKVKESKNPTNYGIDWVGMVLFTISLVFLIFAIVQGPYYGWGSKINLGLFSMSFILLLVFILVEIKTPFPMLDLSLFKHPSFIGVQLLPIATGFSFIALIVYLPIWFIGIKGYSEFQAGLAILPLTAPMVIIPFLSGILAKYFNSTILCSLGLGSAAIGAYSLSNIESQSSSINIVISMIVIGIGNGLPWGLMDGLAMNTVPKERAGMAAGIFSTIRVTGETIAIAIIGAALIGLTTQSLIELKIPEYISINISTLANSVASGNILINSNNLTSAEKMYLIRATGEAYTHGLQVILRVISTLTLFSSIALWFTLRKSFPIRGN